MPGTDGSRIKAAERLENAIRSVEAAQQQLNAAMKELAHVRNCIDEKEVAEGASLSGESFAGRLVRLRAVAGMTQRDLATASGVSIAQVGRYELGTSTPRHAAIAKLAKALNVPTSALA